MAVPFAFPDENNDAEIIIRQLSLLLNRLAVEFKKQRNENIQLRARNKLQSGIIRQVSARRQENSHAAASMNDKVLSAIVTCQHSAIPDGRVVAIRRREVNDAKTESSTQIGKSKASTSSSSTESAETQIEEEDEGPLSYIRARLQWHRRWWSWLAPRTLTRNPFWTTAVICVVGWHLLR